MLQTSQVAGCQPLKLELKEILLVSFPNFYSSVSSSSYLLPNPTSSPPPHTHMHTCAHTFSLFLSLSPSFLVPTCPTCPSASTLQLVWMTIDGTSFCLNSSKVLSHWSRAGICPVLASKSQFLLGGSPCQPMPWTRAAQHCRSHCQPEVGLIWWYVHTAASSLGLLFDPDFFKNTIWQNFLISEF